MWGNYICPGAEGLSRVPCSGSKRAKSLKELRIITAIITRIVEMESNGKINRFSERDHRVAAQCPEVTSDNSPFDQRWDDLIELVRKYAIPLWEPRQCQEQENLSPTQNRNWKLMTSEVRDWLLNNVAVDFSCTSEEQILAQAAGEFGATLTRAWGDKIVSYVRSQRVGNRRSRKFLRKRESHLANKTLAVEEVEEAEEVKDGHTLAELSQAIQRLEGEVRAVKKTLR